MNHLTYRYMYVHAIYMLAQINIDHCKECILHNYEYNDDAILRHDNLRRVKRYSKSDVIENGIPRYEIVTSVLNDSLEPYNMLITGETIDKTLYPCIQYDMPKIFMFSTIPYTISIDNYILERFIMIAVHCGHVKTLRRIKQCTEQKDIDSIISKLKNKGVELTFRCDLDYVKDWHHEYIIRYKK